MGVMRAGIAGQLMRGARGRFLASGAISAALIVTLGAAAAPAADPHARSGAVTDLKFGLNAVSVLSSSDAWAVGDGATVLHWNGTSWVPVKIPGLPAAVYLHAVDALSSSDVWAAGESSAQGGPVTTLILHWDGAAWTRVPSPGPSGTHLLAQLNYLSMDSAADGWAMGSVSNLQHGTSTSLVAHWNGTSWQQVATSPAFSFRGVASFSASNASAVGYDRTSSGQLKPAAFHWNGSGWALAAALPSPSGVSPSQVVVAGLSADSVADVWAIGAYQYSSGPIILSRNLAWHWNGTRWTVMAIPSPGINNAGTSGVVGAATIGPANVWAVGFTGTTSNNQASVSVHWNGTRWTHVASPNPGGSNNTTALLGVDAAGPSNVWAVGYYNTQPDPVDKVPHTLILRWNGTRWIRS
jgi:hypothetical protein